MGVAPAAGAAGLTMGALTVRQPVVAGSFYPADPGALTEAVETLLEAAVGDPSVSDERCRGLIVPHAGYHYSGPVAATAYRHLRASAVRYRGVVLVGPAHFWPLEGAALPATERWATPLGEVSVEAALRTAALEAGAKVDERPHDQEHALEVQLPFLQRVLPGVAILPIAIGTSIPAAVADLLAAVCASPGTLLIVSTDLSHYHEQAVARRLDRRTATAVVARDPAAIRLDDACGAWALRGVLELARRRELTVRLLDLRTSADTAGDPGRVVGYGAFALTA